MSATAMLATAAMSRAGASGRSAIFCNRAITFCEMTSRAPVASSADWLMPWLSASYAICRSRSASTIALSPAPCTFARYAE